jgi:predicted nucleotidyltransferase
MKITNQTFGLKDGDLEIIISILKKYSQITAAKIFGSRAMGNYKVGSDIDIAISGTNIDDIIHRISGELNDESPLPYQFDIVSYNSKIKDLVQHIDEFGIIFFQIDKL